jgi:hypothetical protein
VELQKSPFYATIISTNMRARSALPCLQQAAKDENGRAEDGRKTMQGLFAVRRSSPV